MPERTDIHSVFIIGASLISISQAGEFNYFGVQACKAREEEGHRAVRVKNVQPGSN